MTKRHLAFLSALLALVLCGTAQAATTAQLQSQVSAAMPAANAQVAAAQNQGTLASLIQQVQAMPMPAPNTTSVQQYALLQALQPYTTTTTDPEQIVNDTNALAASTTCWLQGSHLASRINFWQAGVKVGWAEKDHGYWCGNGTSITQNGLPGYYRQHWTPSLTPYCMVDVATTNAWDAPNHGWAHGELVTHFGDYTPWTSCVTFLSGKTDIRISATGKHDTYWDF